MSLVVVGVEGGSVGLVGEAVILPQIGVLVQAGSSIVFGTGGVIAQGGHRRNCFLLHRLGTRRREKEAAEYY